MIARVPARPQGFSFTRVDCPSCGESHTFPGRYGGARGVRTMPCGVVLQLVDECPICARDVLAKRAPLGSLRHCYCGHEVRADGWRDRWHMNMLRQAVESALEYPRASRYFVEAEVIIDLAAARRIDRDVALVTLLRLAYRLRLVRSEAPRLAAMFCELIERTP